MKFLSIKEVCEKVLYSPAHIARLTDPNSPYYDPTFPKKVKLGNNRSGYLESEVEDWMQSKLELRQTTP